MAVKKTNSSSKPASKTAAKKAHSKTNSKAPTSVTVKKTFDTTAFVFETPVEAIEEALEVFDARDKDDMAEPFTEQELYWWGWWLLNLPEAKRRGMKTVPTSAIESRVLGLYTGKKSTKRSRK